ncbi:MAG: UDP-N-acetylmuramoyl-L-alanyl-D-glutamate--2,6-diaminopimelate ligase [Actinomycetota bacterium]
MAELLDGELAGDPSVRVVDASHDSRQIKPGWMFIAVPGGYTDGHDYISAATGNGAAALCVSRPVKTPLPSLMVADTRRAMPALAAAIHDHPSARTRVVGVTGTNGKTTVTFMLESIIRATGAQGGLIGTVVSRAGDHVFENPRTTPEATDFQRLLALMVASGAEVIACEVSSHALALGRVEETRFEVGAFTNLTQDHLDFHPSMEAYFEAKAHLLEMAEKQTVWISDPYGARLARRYRESLTVGWDGEVTASNTILDRDGTRFVLELPDGPVPTRIRLAGRFNLSNALMAAACAHLVGFSGTQIAAGLEALRTVPGRFERVATKRGPTVVVDYAHTPDGIATVIDAARHLTEARVIAVIGAGGDRDRGKRPEMGRAATGADLVIVTSDNPRSEDPDAIIDQVVAGMGGARVIRITDRRTAIAQALTVAETADIVLILGKGHETGQEIGGVVHPFSDRQVVTEELARLEGRA